jgi:hypothetical protein
MRTPAVLALLLLAAREARPQDSASPPRWYKGNTHAHTRWDNGDSLPEVVAGWYRDHGYAFVGLSDHNAENALTGKERWVDLRPSDPLEDLECRFGSGWAVTRGEEGRRQIRLKTFPELEKNLSEAGRFILLPAQEIGDAFGGRLVHHNVLNLERIILPPGGDSVSGVMERALDRSQAEADRSGRLLAVHLNHPNLGWAVGAGELEAVANERFFEIYNGHPAARNAGDSAHPGTEETWDRVLTARVRSGRAPLLYGLAADDAHDFTGRGDQARPGRGWIFVRARELTGDALVRAMLAGDFYSSTGVTLEEVHAGECSLFVKVAPEAGATYTIRFVGAGGVVLQESRGTQSTYFFQGSELYVRAVVVSDRPLPDPARKGEVMTAWVQPIVIDWAREK